MKPFNKIFATVLTGYFILLGLGPLARAHIHHDLAKGKQSTKIHVGKCSEKFYNCSSQCPIESILNHVFEKSIKTEEFNSGRLIKPAFFLWFISLLKSRKRDSNFRTNVDYCPVFSLQIWQESSISPRSPPTLS